MRCGTIWASRSKTLPPPIDRSSALYDKFSLLAANPLLGEVRNDLGTNLRSFVAGNYVVVYRTIGSKIEVSRVVHAARDIRAVFAVEARETDDRD